MRALVLFFLLAGSAVAGDYPAATAGGTSVTPWGNLVGSIERQGDLVRLLDEKQPLILQDLKVPGDVYAGNVCIRGIVEATAVQFPDGSRISSALIDGGAF